MIPPLDDYAELMLFINLWERDQAEFLGMLLYKTLTPESVIDWGCASGLYLVPFQAKGCKILGLDADRTAGREIGYDFRCADIRQEIYIPTKYDLALCIETAEHLQEDYADPLVRNVANSADVVFWSAASPGQGGQHHYNEQLPGYWLSKFMDRGFRIHPRHDEVKGAIRQNPHCQKVQWLIPNALLLERER